MSLSRFAPLTMWQKEQQWTAWWADRTKLMQDDGTRTTWEKEQAVLREKKNWWLYTFCEPYWTVEDKELQWRSYCEEAHGVGSQPVDGLEKRQWWRKTWGEDPPLSGPQIDLAREEEIAEARARNQELHKEELRKGFCRTLAECAHVEEIAAARAFNEETHKEDFRNGFCRTVAERDTLRAHVEGMAAQQRQRPVSLPRPPMENPVFFGCPACSDFFPNRHDCDTHIKADHGTGEAKVIFHPQATEEELKACLFANLPWQDRILLSQTVHSSDMDLCYVTKRLVLREPGEEYGEGDNPFTDGVR